MRCSDVSVVMSTRPHFGGIRSVNQNRVKIRKPESFYVRVICRPCFRLAYNSTHNSWQAYENLRRYTAATSTVHLQHGGGNRCLKEWRNCHPVHRPITTNWLLTMGCGWLRRLPLPNDDNYTLSTHPNN